MKKTRLFALALAGAMSLSLLAACGGNSDPTPSPNAPTPSPVTETTATPEPTQPAESVTPSTEPSTEATADPTGEPTVQPTPEPTVQPTPESSSTPAADVAVADIWSAIASNLELPDLMDLDDDLLSALYGIDAADLDEYVAKMPLMNVHATEFFIAKVKPDKMSTVKDGISARLADLKAQWERYLPEQLELVNNAQVVESGDYILFCVAEDAEGAVELFQDCTK